MDGQPRARQRWHREVGETLAGVPHAMAGAVAANEYMAPRQTTDLDVLVTTRSIGRAERAMEQVGWASDAIRAARGNVLGGRRVLTLPYLVLAKLTSTRSIDLGDLSRVPGAASGEELDELRRVVRRWPRPEDIEDLKVIASGKLEWVGQSEPPP